MLYTVMVNMCPLLPKIWLMLGTTSPWIGLIFSLCSLILLHFSSLVASPVTLHFAMFSTPSLDSVFLRMCGVSLLELSSLLFRALWFFIGIWCLIAFICVPQFADFVLSLSLSLFSQLVTLFIVGCVSGGFPFRHVRHSRIGSAMLYTGQKEFYGSVEKTFMYIVNQATGVLTKLTSLWDSIQSAKDIQLDGHNLFPPQFRGNIDHFNNMIKMSNITYPDRVANQTIRYLTGALNPVRLVLNVIAGIMLAVTFLGLLFSFCGLRVLVYLLVIVGWILVTATILLSAVFLVFHNVVADTCTAMDQWVHDPAAESALSQLLPCLDAKTIGDTLDITKTMTSTAVDMTNAYTVNISNFDHFPHNNPFYHNQSGPLVPLLCNPLDEHHNPRPCAPNEILLANASQIYKGFVCQVNAEGICITQGRLTQASYDQMMGAINVGFTLDHYGPFLASIADCTFVRDTFRDITTKNCPGLSITSQWIYAGLASLSGAVMFSLIFWMIFVRERRHRSHSKKTVQMNRF
ncbi:hypothetical protein YC2023_023716 [Brassica napus]